MFRKTVQLVLSASVRTASRSLMTVRPTVRVAAPVFKVNVASVSKLSEALLAEFEHERANETVDQEFVDMEKKIKKSFSIEDVVGKSIVVLRRKYKNEEIAVFFDCQDTVEMEDEVQEEESESEEAEPVLGLGVNFRVEIVKNNQKVVVDCIGGDSLQVNFVRYIDSATKAHDDVETYGGPELGDLADDVQNEVFEYLSERKIDDDLAYFVNIYSREKEQKEYVNWLDKVSNFVE